MKNYKESNMEVKEPLAEEKEAEFFKLIRGEYKDEFQKLFDREFKRRFKNMKETEEELALLKETLKPLCDLYESEDYDFIVKSITDAKNKNTMDDKNLNEHFERWKNEAMKTAEKYPGFNFASEFENPDFRAGLMSGIPMENLYQGMHFDELAKIISEAAAKATVDNIRAGHGRINEVGSEVSHSVKAKKDVKSLTDSEIDEYLEKIRRGEKISFD